MNIWTLTTDSDSGTDCQVFYSEAAANDAAKAFLTPIWQRHYSDAASVPAMPVDWRDAWEVLSDSSEDWLTLQCHTITDHPEIARVVEALAPLAHLIEQPEADTSLPLDVLWKIRDCTWSAALRLHGNDVSAAETALSCAVRDDAAPASIGSTVDRLILSVQELQQMRELVRMMQHNANYSTLYAKLNAATLEMCA